MISSLFWTILFESLKLILRILSVVVLARLLSPQDYGLFAVLLIFISFATVFTDGCFGQLVIRKSRVDTHVLTSIFILNLGLIILITSVLYFFRHAISDFIGVAEFSRFIPFISAVFLLRVLSMVPSALMQRYRKFYQLSKLEFCAYAFSVVGVAIPLAAFGAGVFSLVFMYIFNELSRFVLLWWHSSIKYSFFSLGRIDVRSLKYVFGLQVSEFVNVIALQVDNVLVSRFWGVENLGLYSRAYYITSQPANIFGSSVSKVVFANFSRYRDDRRKVCNNLFRGVVLVFLIFVPFSTLGYVYSEQIVGFVLGQAWMQAAESFGWLCLGIPIRIGHKLNAQVLKARGLIWQFAVINFIFVCAITAGILWVRGGELSAVALAVLQSYALVTALSFCVAVKSLSPPLRDFTALCSAILIILALLGASLMLHYLLLRDGLNAYALPLAVLVFIFSVFIVAAILRGSFGETPLYQLLSPIIGLAISVSKSTLTMLERARVRNA